MSRFFVVVDDLKDWSPYYPSQDVVTFAEYLEQADQPPGAGRVRVINLCRDYRYLSTGYYCALLAEARGHHVFPSVRTLNDLRSRPLSDIQLDGVESLLRKLDLKDAKSPLVLRCWFGECLEPELAGVAKAMFERFPCPLLELTLEKRKNWHIRKLQPVSLKALKTATEQDAFANSFESFSSKMWRQPKARKAYRFDLAILVNPDEEMPPSDEVALKRFVRAADNLGIAAEFITKKDYLRIPEYDGLFIRETTAVDNHTYSFAKKAEAEGLVVFDDPTSILRCTNKIYLAELLRTHNVPAPKTEILRSGDRGELEEAVANLGYPLVLKIPDGSFSRGIVKVDNWDDLVKESERLLKESALLLIQEYMYTEYDWRIGVLNNKPLYACRYYMVRNHWQIYKHGGGGGVKSGAYDAMPTFEAPKKVLDAAIRATRHIGDGFYGVDLKQSGDRVVVIEVNDNPSVESAVEDKYLGNQLYDSIMEEFLRRMEARRR